MLVSIRVQGHIKDGQLHVDLPENLPDEQFELIVKVIPQESPLTSEEVEQLMQANPKSGKEIAQSDSIGIWADRDIEDSVEWVYQQQELRRDKLNW